MKPLVHNIAPLLASLLLMSPVLAQTAATIQTAKPAALTAAPVLDSLIGKPQIVGMTKQDKTRFLGRVISGDHGMYIVQTFQFAGPPHVTSQTTTTQGTPRLSGSGRNRHYMTPKPTYHTTKMTEATVIPDDEAVRLLLTGVAGSNTDPGEVQKARQMVAASEVAYVQALSPPKKTSIAVKPSVPASPGVALPVSASPMAWTLTTIWPPKGAPKGR